MQAGRLDRRIIILRSSPTFDGLQHKLGDPAEFISRAASATPVRDSERFASGETQASITMRFQVRYDSDTATIDERDLVSFEGRTYGIAAVKELGRREGLEITATARAERP